jgi:hypothetical protein
MHGSPNHPSLEERLLNHLRKLRKLRTSPIVQRDLIDLKRTAENVQESLSVGIGEKDVLPSVAAAGHMVAGILILDT